MSNTQTIKSVDLSRLSTMSKVELLNLLKPLKVIYGVVNVPSIISNNSNLIKIGIEYANKTKYSYKKQNYLPYDDITFTNFSVEDVYNKINIDEKKQINGNNDYLKHAGITFAQIPLPKYKSSIMQKIKRSDFDKQKKCTNIYFVDLMNVSYDNLMNISEKEVLWLCSQYNNISKNPKLAQEHNISSCVYVYKGKGKSTDVNSFRPIMMIPNIVKYLHKIYHDRLFEYFNNNKYFDKEICKGGIKGVKNGVTEQVLKIRYCLDIAKKENRSCCIVFIDISNAFGNVDINILCSILNTYRVDPEFINYIKYYYTDFKYYVSGSHNKKKWVSDILDIKKGLIQGCPLSMCLFNIYINYILVNVNANFIKNYGFVFMDDVTLLFNAYVDDIAIICKDVKSAKKIFAVLVKIFALFGFTINQKKSAFIAINDNTETDENFVTKVKEWEYLGFMINPTKTSNDYINDLFDKLSKKLIKLAKNTSYSDQQKIRIIVNSVIPYIKRQYMFLPECSIDVINTNKIIAIVNKTLGDFGNIGIRQEIEYPRFRSSSPILKFMITNSTFLDTYLKNTKVQSDPNDVYTQLYSSIHHTNVLFDKI